MRVLDEGDEEVCALAVGLRSRRSAGSAPLSSRPGVVADTQMRLPLTRPRTRETHLGQHAAEFVEDNSAMPCLDFKSGGRERGKRTTQRCVLHD